MHFLLMHYSAVTQSTVQQLDSALSMKLPSLSSLSTSLILFLILSISNPAVQQGKIPFPQSFKYSTTISLQAHTFYIFTTPFCQKFCTYPVCDTAKKSPLYPIVEIHYLLYRYNHHLFFYERMQ